ncbi:MAG: transglycosylase SLT domain-containing protein [Methyloprofundus sp.]|nr:transglycosylase SLT domain-containing protein [Methyloprofundus sp.]
MMWIKFYQLVLLGTLFFPAFEAAAGNLEQQRLIFLQAEKTIKAASKEEFAVISSNLKAYPLTPYLEYQWLGKHLAETVQVQAFLRNNKSSRYAGKLRQQWLNYLYKKQQWADFVQFSKSSKRKQQQCRYQWAQYQLNRKTIALTATKKIWLTGRSLPKDCDALLAKFTQSKFLTQKLIWQRFELAVKAKQLTLAKYLSGKLSSEAKKKQANIWLKVVNQPSRIASPDFLQGIAQPQHLAMRIYAMKRLISDDVDKAMLTWAEQKRLYPFNQVQLNRTDTAIAMQLAFNKSELAYGKFTQLKYHTASTRIWTVRAALIEHNWTHVQRALNKLSAKQMAKERWRYWQARAFAETGQSQKANTIYQKLAKERSYYGFMAANYLQQDYSLDDKPIVLDELKKMALLATKKFRVVQEFRAIQRENKAQANWWNALKGLSKKQVLLAAKIAQQWQWNKHAILTVARVRHWSDVELRFPVDFVGMVNKNAQLQQLEPAIIYALIRRESMFDEAARSPVGALGLMQVMPRTGKQIARQIKYPWRSTSVLLHADTNVKFGAYYIKQRLNEFDGRFALAAAAYNAGPHRVDKWLKMHRDYDADIWVETIPFKETRAYVAAVLSYALIYQKRLGEGSLTMADFMRDIQRVE